MAVTEHKLHKKMLMAVCHFPPDAAIGAAKPAKFGKYLPEFGWEPSLGRDYGRAG
jgi:hypothetical protein